MHRNTFIYSPALLRPTLQFHNRDDLFFAGQITGVEGYAGNIVTGCWRALTPPDWHKVRCYWNCPQRRCSALCHYVTHASAADFQPMKANFGILPPLEMSKKLGKRDWGLGRTRSGRWRVLEW